jgi:hypothetical protein
MDSGVLQSVDAEVIATENFAQLSAQGHDFRYGDGHLGGGPLLGRSFYATDRGISCTRCGRKFEFKRVSDQGWELDRESKIKLKFSCAEHRAQNVANRNRLAQLIANWSKN